MERGYGETGKFPIKPTEEPDENADNPYFSVGLSQYNLVYEKFGIPIDKALELDNLTFNKLLRDALCLRFRETEEGRQYLKDCWRLQQTEPDIKAIEKYKRLTEAQ